MNRKLLTFIGVGVSCLVGAFVFWLMQPDRLRECLRRGLNHSLYEWIDDAEDRQDMKQLMLDVAIDLKKSNLDKNNNSKINDKTSLSKFIKKLQDVNKRQQPNTKELSYYMNEFLHLERYNCQN